MYDSKYICYIVNRCQKGNLICFRRGANIMEIRNVMEEFVFKHLDKIVNSDDTICRCDKCRIDVAMLALNNLKPHYVSTDKGSIYTNFALYEKNNEVDIMCAIGRAVKIVGDNPRHDESR
ncbi:MAG: Late competence development protein ComFB [Firmicutes bacterium]|nr:Late competence development protein ComFB [Bacillota bacterium]